MASPQFFDIIPAYEFNVTASKANVDSNPSLYFDGSDIAWMMTSSALVFLMIPGVALFNSGISSKGSALSMVFLPMLTASIVALQWWLWGYSIAFSQTPGSFWGNAEHFTLRQVAADPSGNENGRKIPEVVKALYEGMFACFTAALVSGCVIKKGRFGPFLVFMVIWTTVIYDPIARWTWNSAGWSNRWGALDFAGGTVVHISAAYTAAAYSAFFRLRARFFRKHGFKASSIELREREIGQDLENRAPSSQPNIQRSISLTNAILGTVLLWTGWFGFNGGSALGANVRAASACISTFLSACAGGASWCFLDYILLSLSRKLKARHPSLDSGRQGSPGLGGKFSVLGFCNGAIAGLVAITPAAGYVPCRSSPLFGLVGAVVCSLCMYRNLISHQLLDTLNIFVIHGIGGAVGMIMTGVFASKETAALDGYTVIQGGWLDHNWKQIGFQICDALAGAAYAGGGTVLILLLLEVAHYVIWKRPMDDGSEVTDADDIIDNELF